MMLRTPAIQRLIGRLWDLSGAEAAITGGLFFGRADETAGTIYAVYTVADEGSEKHSGGWLGKFTATITVYRKTTAAVNELVLERLIGRLMDNPAAADLPGIPYAKVYGIEPAKTEVKYEDQRRESTDVAAASFGWRILTSS